MINQTNREAIIKLLDESFESVKLEDLFLFDLSPYYNEKKNETFFSKQLEYQKERDLLKHSVKGIFFSSEQKKIYDEIFDENNKRLIISAPTSFGKTMLIKELIFNKQPEKVVFIVPTNSLSDELIDDFIEIYSALGYTIYDTVKEDSEIQKKSIFIGTQEKFYQIYQGRNIEIDLFVIDEAYKLGDQLNGSREVILNRTFIDTLNISKRSILLLPLVNQIEGLSLLDFKTLRSEYTPVAKNFKSIADNEFDLTIINKITENRESNLVYFDSPNKVEDFYLKHQNNFKNHIVLSDDWIKRVEIDFHPEWIPIQSLKNGIGIHYGPIPKFIQKKVVKLFVDCNLKTILATSSIIEGVNTPTKNIFITTSKKLLDNKHVIKFKNLIGRAGRLGIHKVGNIYLKNMHKDAFDKVNIPYTDISLKFILESEVPVVEINREFEFKVINPDFIKDASDKTFEVEHAKTIDYFSNSGLGNIPFFEISKILNEHGFTISQVQKLIEYSKKEDINIIGILGILKSSDNDLPKCINIIISSKYESITDILNELNIRNSFPQKTNSQIVSIIMKMIYNVIPHKVIPALDFLIELNTIYVIYNGENLISVANIKEANIKKSQFFSKFIGEELIQVEESKKIMLKLFEYGIPYFRVKSFINEIVANVPDNFSIYDIKKVIYKDDSMKELRIYFE